MLQIYLLCQTGTLDFQFSCFVVLGLVSVMGCPGECRLYGDTCCAYWDSNRRTLCWTPLIKMEHFILHLWPNCNLVWATMWNIFTTNMKFFTYFCSCALDLHVRANYSMCQHVPSWTWVCHMCISLCKFWASLHLICRLQCRIPICLESLMVPVHGTSQVTCNTEHLYYYPVQCRSSSIYSISTF